MSIQVYNALPLSVKERVKNTLRSYSKVYIDFYWDEYHVTTSTMLCAKYPSDFKAIGEVDKDDIYTEDEQIINYIESFYDYPYNYKGKRDYDIMRYMATQNGNAKVRLLPDGTARLIV